MSNICMRFPGGKRKALTLSYDDGVEQDIRLIDIMKKHGLKGTFNINSGMYAPEGTVYPEGTIHRRMSKSMALELYQNSGMEVAVHGLKHPFLEQLPANLEQLLECGVLFQCNAEAFLHFGSRGWALKLVDRELVHFLGSDAHNLTTRKPNLGDAARVIEKKLGGETLEDLMAFSRQQLLGE